MFFKKKIERKNKLAYYNLNNIMKNSLPVKLWIFYMKL